MNMIRKTIGQLFGTAKELSTMEQVSASAVANAAEVEIAETAETEETEEVPTETETPAAPEAAPVATVVAPAPVAAAPVETMVHVSATELLRLQAGANAYDAIKAEHAQLKQWHANAQGGIGLGPDANTATEGKTKHVSAATQRAIDIANERNKYAV